MRAVRFSCAFVVWIAIAGCHHGPSDSDAVPDPTASVPQPATVETPKPESPPSTPESPPAVTTGPPQVVQMELKGQDDTNPKLHYGNCQWLYPHDEPQEKLLEQPACKSSQPVYYAAQYGDAEDNVYTFLIDESGGPGTGYNVVYVDANNDNRIDASEERFEFQLGTTRKTHPLRLRILVRAGGAEAPYHVNFAAFPYSSEKHPIEKIHAKDLEDTP